MAAVQNYEVGYSATLRRAICEELLPKMCDVRSAIVSRMKSSVAFIR